MLKMEMVMMCPLILCKEKQWAKFVMNMIDELSGSTLKQGRLLNGGEGYWNYSPAPPTHKKGSQKAVQYRVQKLIYGYTKY